MNRLRGIEIVAATSLRIPPAERIENLHYYDVRHDDDCLGEPVSVEKFVLVNHLGTIVTREPLPLTDACIDGHWLELTEEEQGIVLSVL